jgi:hypothetical protein
MSMSKSGKLSTKYWPSCRQNVGRSIVCRSNDCSLYFQPNVGVDKMSVDQMSVDELSLHLKLSKMKLRVKNRLKKPFVTKHPN